ncbi:MAG: HD domain-containing protein [Desulfobacterales bacterium]|jgi:tRNA nucleotidyltransferase/poly(A) polymerase
MIHIDPTIFPKADGAFLVGGSIRDMLCDRSPVDYDVAVLGDPFEFARLIATRTKGRLVEIGKPGHKIIRVVSDSTSVDVTQAKDASIQKDLMSRDFTINAMAYDLSAQQMVDPMNGRRDLHKRTIRMVSEDIFKRDPVRLLRAYRIAAQFAFEIESKTKAAISENAELVRQSAGERVRDELFKMLQSAGAHPYLCQMADNDLLFTILPELADLTECRQNQHHQFNAWEHTLLAFYHLERLLNPGGPVGNGAGAQLARGIAEAQFSLLKFSVLMHDIGKPFTQGADRNGTLHFYGHERRSARMAKHICRRLKCSNQVAETVQFLVRHHIRPLHLYTALRQQNATRLSSSKSTPRAVTRFFIKCGAYLPELLMLAAADALGKTEKLSRQSSAFMAFFVQLRQDFDTEFKPRASRPQLLGGQDLIAEFGLKPSPLFKKILDRVEEERLSRREMTRQDAVQLVRKLIEGQGSTEEE